MAYANLLRVSRPNNTLSACFLTTPMGPPRPYNSITQAHDDTRGQAGTQAGGATAVIMVGTPSRHTGTESYMGLDDGQIGLSISRVPTPALPSSTSSVDNGEHLVTVDLDLPPTSTAAAFIDEHGHVGRVTSEPGGKVLADADGLGSHKRAPSEVTVTDALSSSSCTYT